MAVFGVRGKGEQGADIERPPTTGPLTIGHEKTNKKLETEDQRQVIADCGLRIADRPKGDG